MHPKKKTLSPRAKSKMICKQLRSISIRATEAAVMRHVRRAERGLKEQLDAHSQGWYEGLQGGEFDFRRKRFIGSERKLPQSNLPLEVLTRLGKLKLDLPPAQRAEFGFVPLDPSDVVETVTLTYAFNLGVAERICSPYYGPFALANAA